MKTRCEVCGIGYSGPRIGDICNDRSGAIRRAVKDGRDVSTARTCQGRLVRLEDFKFYHRPHTTT